MAESYIDISKTLDNGYQTDLRSRQDAKTKLPQERPKIDYLDRVHLLLTATPFVPKVEYGMRTEKDLTSLMYGITKSLPSLCTYGVSPLPDATKFRPSVVGYDFKPEQYR